MRDKKIQLSISVLVSNSINTIKNCMESIVPILNNIPSELIIVDTGGTDGSIEIAKEYTDKIVPFTWCDDFAKARNVGLEKAKGQWFMYLDDDEWFENVDEIIDFFKSGEYLHYNCASYAVRDYRDKEGTRWSDTRASRMIKLEESTTFISLIHEVLEPRYSPEKFFNSYTNHYGYVFENKEEEQKHADRNIRLLEKALAEDKWNHRLMMQLAQEYSAILDNEKSIEISKIDLEAIDQKEVRTESDIMFAGWHMNNITNLELLINRREEAYQDAREYLSREWINNVTKNNLSQILTRLTFESKIEEACIYALDLYLKTYDILQKNREERLHHTITYQCKSYDAQNYYLSLRAGFKTAIQIGRQEKMLEYLERMSKTKFFLTTREDFVEVINVLFRISDEDLRIKMIESFLKDSNFKKYLYKVLEDESIQIPREEIFLYLIGRGEDDVSDLSFQQWLKQMASFVEKASWETLLKIKDLADRHKESDIRLSNLRKFCLEKILVNSRIQKMSYTDMTELLNHYIDTVIECNSVIYKKEVFDTSLEFYLPDNFKFCNKIKDLRELEGDNLAKAKRLREAVELHPNLASFCKIYIKKMQEETTAAENEFLNLASMIKKSIRTYIKMGQIENAKITLTQLEQLIPNDPEVAELKKLLV